MENLNNLIWTDEDDNNGNGIQPQEMPMQEKCLVAFCLITAGTLYACRVDAPSHQTSACD